MIDNSEIRHARSCLLAARERPRAGSKQMAMYQPVAQTQSSGSSSNLCCSVATQTWHAHVARSLLHTKPTVTLYTYHVGTPKHTVCCVCVFSFHSFWTSCSLDVPAGVTQEESHTGFLISTFFLRCVPQFFSREGFSHSFPSSTVMSEFVY